MKLCMKKLLFLFFAVFHNYDYAEINMPVLLIAGAVTQQSASILPSLQNTPGNNLVVNALNTAAIIAEPMAQNSLTISGNMVFNGNVLTITLPTDISQL